MTVADLGERTLLARILARLPRPPASVLVGPGDDAAVVAPTRNERLVVTADALVEGVHFSHRYCAPADVGYKALAASLSDLAAMGAAPRWALLSLVLPDATPVADVEALVDGCAELARTFGVAVVGGNIARTPGPLVIDLTAGGEARPRRWLTRSGARAGDEIYVSGTVGAARAGLEMLREEPQARSHEPKAGACVARQLRPEPRVALGVAVARARAARAAMDLSDGLADALRQIAAASGCGALVDAAALPVDEGARAWWERRGVDAVQAALAGGEDYELLFAVPPRWSGRLRMARRHVAAPPLTRIGAFTREAGRLLVERDGRLEDLPAGFEHFR